MGKKKRKISQEEYRKAMEELGNEGKKQLKQSMRSNILIGFLIIINVLLYLFSDESFIDLVGMQIHSFSAAIVLPYFICLIVFIVISILNTSGVFKSLRCPKCRRFFPGGKLTRYTSFQSSDMRPTSDGAAYFTTKTNFVYWTECKSCGHVIWVVK
ncbi:MAG: hypothetical protein OEZ34_15445 [Spirochaetia bacterium]|nr:hypothetical protein [Spirochaetia bacterium]